MTLIVLAVTIKMAPVESTTFNEIMCIKLLKYLKALKVHNEVKCKIGKLMNCKVHVL